MVYNNKGSNISATIVLGIWIVIISIGLTNTIISFLESFLGPNSSIIWLISFNNLFLYFGMMLTFFPSKNIASSIFKLIKEKHWIKPTKFVFNIVIQLGIAITASILTITTGYFNSYSPVNLDGFNFYGLFLLFSTYSFLFSILFFVACLYYYGSPAFAKRVSIFHDTSIS